MKNPKPKTIAFYTSLLVAVVSAVVSFFFTKSFTEAAVIFLISFLSGYLFFYYAIENFIYRKIKLVYKTIHHLKASKDEPSLKEKVMDDPLEMVNEEVMEYEKERATEIEQLRKVEIYRKEFVANVTHELKTPLFNIQGYIHTLLDGAIEDKEVNRMFLEKGAKNVERLCNLVDDLETISQLETGGSVFEPEVFDIHLLIQDVFDSLEFKARQRDVTFSFKKESNVPFYVSADKEKIRQVLINLIENSIKYGKKDGNTQVGMYDMDENILIEITDNGIGIGEEHLSRLFERFYRVDKSRSREQGGTGLGLAIVKHIIEAHGQTINVRSRVGVGTTFAFTLEKK